MKHATGSHAWAMLLVSWLAVQCAAGQTVVVVLDDSGSMERRMENRQRRIEVAKQSLTHVLRALPYDTKVGILALNSRVNGSHWVVPVGSPDPARWTAAVQSLQAKGGTPLGEYIRQAADELLRLRSQEPFESYRLLVVTDGEASDAPLLSSILPDLLSRGLNLDVIGVAMKDQHSLARLAHSYRSANDAQSLTQALGEVFAETGSDDQAAGADFDLISGLPDPVASVIVQGLTTPRNDPLGQSAIARSDLPLGSLPTTLPSGDNRIQPPATPDRMGRVSSAFSALIGTLCCFGGFVFFITVVLAIVLGAVKKNSRS